MTKQIKTKRYSWGDFTSQIQEIVDDIKSKKLKFDFVIGIPRGGSIMGVVLSHKLDIPYMELSDFTSKPFSYSNILLVDEIADTGETLKRRLRFFSRPKTTIITLNYKNQSTIIPDYYVEKVDNEDWVIYPWEV